MVDRSAVCVRQTVGGRALPVPMGGWLQEVHLSRVLPKNQTIFLLEQVHRLLNRSLLPRENNFTDYASELSHPA